MELDVYTPCPVHPEKKIKFCCGKEIASELNQIFSKFEARQPAAALDSLNRLIEKVGPKDCLQSLKVQLLASLGEYEQAGEANEQFLAANPNHSVGLEQRAVMLANQGRVNEAFDALQTAMDNPGRVCDGLSRRRNGHVQKWLDLASPRSRRIREGAKAKRRTN